MTTVFAFRIGPVVAGDQRVNFYVPMASDCTFEVVDAVDDAEGLRRIAAMCAGCELTCEPALGPAGAPLGFQVVEFDARKAEQAAVVAASIAMSDYLVELRDRSLLLSFLRQAGAYRQAGLHRFWPASVPIRVRLRGSLDDKSVDRRFEVAITERTLFAFWSKGALERFEQLVGSGRAHEADQLDRYSIAFGTALAYALPALERGYRLDAVPETYALVSDQKVRCNDDDFAVMTSLLFALARVSPNLAREPFTVDFADPGGTRVVTAELEAGAVVGASPA